ncbi:MAG TPA: NAD(P)/FAD-dependent oxidoreductase [Phycisphaerae bacterium]|nr:NAD(P)/FAD-dependent oxidoreductase [Phycisphaerae bacterium]
MRDLPDDLQEAGWQSRADTMPDATWEVVVVGAGPAGAMSALHLARQGRRVLLLDRARFPRDKTCGDGLITDALDELMQVGLLERVARFGHRLSTAVIFSPGGAEFRIPAEYVTVPRRLLDAMIAREAVRAGAVFGHGQVAEATAEPGGGYRLRIVGCTRKASTRAMVVATGSSIGLGRRIGLVTQPQPSAVGVRCYVRSSVELDHIVGAFLRPMTPGYGWIFPMGDGLYNVGAVLFDHASNGRRLNVRDAFTIFTRDFPPARELLAAGQPVTPPKGAALRCGLRGSRLHGPGDVLAVGEAAGATLPLLGEGIGKAMYTGRIAAEVIHEALQAGDMRMLGEYPRRLERDLRSLYRGLTRAQRWVGVPWISDIMSRRVPRSQYLQETLTRLVRGTCDPAEVFSLRAVLRSLVR